MNTFLDQFLEYHYHRILDGRVTNVLKHCHVRGMWSIVLHDEPENRIRIFFADKDHKLHMNNGFNRSNKPMTLAIHPHHCNVVLYPLFGSIHNITFTESPNMFHQDKVEFIKMKYNSAILNTSPSIDVIGTQSLYYNRKGDYQMYGPMNMHAKELHTIRVAEDSRAAWIVFEGKEDDTYENVMYSNNPTFDFSQHYDKNFTQDELISVFVSTMNQTAKANEMAYRSN